MAGKKTLETRMASMPEVLGILEDRQTSGELGYEQQLVLEHATKFSKLKESDAKKLKKELEEAGLSTCCMIRPEFIAWSQSLMLRFMAWRSPRYVLMLELLMLRV